MVERGVTASHGCSLMLIIGGSLKLKILIIENKALKILLYESKHKSKITFFYFTSNPPPYIGYAP